MAARGPNGREGRTGRLPAGLIPRGLSDDQAAAYCGLSRNTFAGLVEVGQLPRPLPLKCGRRIYDLRALDRALDRLAGLVNDRDADVAALDRTMGLSDAGADEIRS